MKTAYATCIGPAINGTVTGQRWCNAHLHVFIEGESSKYDIVVDTDHPEYGLLATLQYPSDSYPFIVVGGSKSGKTLIFAPVTTKYGDTFISKEYALANFDPSRARVLRMSKRGPLLFGDNMVIGSAYYHISREV